MNKFQNAIDKVNKEFKNNCFTAEIMDVDNKIVQIDIDGGDWKHDHGFADYTMSVNGFTKLDEQITSEDGSDWYGSVHFYVFNN